MPLFTYPQLSAIEQANLPNLMALPNAIPSKFDDSTHHLWHCQTDKGEMVLKACNDASISKSPFWLGVNDLFDADFPNSLGNIQLTHDFLKQNGALKVPDFVASASKRFILTRFLAGVDLETDQINDQWVIALAKHIAQLHQCTYPHWGHAHSPQFGAQEWATRLPKTLSLLAENYTAPIDKAWLNAILAQAAQVRETVFVPMMLDLRWDQLRALSEGGLALIDLDAFVIGPKNLDLVLLSYVLSPVQLALFKQHYKAVHPWPDQALQNPCYQLLLFLMNVLGETNLAHWMRPF